MMEKEIPPQRPIPESKPPFLLSQKSTGSAAKEEAELKKSSQSANLIPDTILTTFTKYFKAVTEILHIEEKGPALKNSKKPSPSEENSSSHKPHT